VGAERHGREILTVVVAARSGDGGANDVGDGADRQTEVEDVAEEFDDTAEGTVADEGQAEDNLAE
jgi:hypothetical protein